MYMPYYSCGTIVISSATSVKITNTNFTQNEGWRTGGIAVENLNGGVLNLNNCQFSRNKAIKGDHLELSYDVYDIGNDIIVDHLFKRNNISDNIK
jgi:hypothetical protein